MRSSRFGLFGACVVLLVIASPCPAQSLRPAGTVTRPTDGVRHPELDKAWDRYDAIVAKSAEGIRAALLKQFDAATETGDLDVAERWQATVDAFETSGAIPYQSEIKSVMSAIVSDLKIAKEELIAVYGDVAIALTKAKEIEEARATREEAVEIRKVVPKQKPKPQGPRIVEEYLDLSKPNTQKLFRFGGMAKPDKEGVEFPKKPGNAFAEYTKVVAFPLKVTFVAKTFENGNFDIHTQILTAPAANGGDAGIKLHWGWGFNRDTLLHVFGKTHTLKHTPIVAGEFNAITMVVDKNRKLTVEINDLVIHQEVLAPFLKLEGYVRCAGGQGHVLFKSVTIETEAAK